MIKQFSRGVANKWKEPSLFQTTERPYYIRKINIILAKKTTLSYRLWDK